MLSSVGAQRAGGVTAPGVRVPTYLAYAPNSPLPGVGWASARNVKPAAPAAARPKVPCLRKSRRENGSMKSPLRFGRQDAAAFRIADVAGKAAALQGPPFCKDE